MTKVVFDCMVFLQAAARPAGPAAACLRAVRERRIELVVCPLILAEIRDVLTRPRTLAKFSSLTTDAVGAFVRDIELRAVTLVDVPRVFTLERDPKDEPYINLAIASRAAYLATWDRDLLDLMNEEASRRQFPGLTILPPPALLKLLEPA